MNLEGFAKGEYVINCETEEELTLLTEEMKRQNIKTYQIHVECNANTYLKFEDGLIVWNTLKHGREKGYKIVKFSELADKPICPIGCQLPYLCGDGNDKYICTNEHGKKIQQRIKDKPVEEDKPSLCDTCKHKGSTLKEECGDDIVRVVECKDKPIEDKPRWRAEEDEIYFYVDENGEVDEAKEYSTCRDVQNYNIGNYFRTKEEAEEYREYLLQVQKTEAIDKRELIELILGMKAMILITDEYSRGLYNSLEVLQANIENRESNITLKPAEDFEPYYFTKDNTGVYGYIGKGTSKYMIHCDSKRPDLIEKEVNKLIELANIQLLQNDNRDFQPTKTYLMSHKDEYAVEYEKSSDIEKPSKIILDSYNEDLTPKNKTIHQNVTKIYRLVPVWTRPRELTIEECEREFGVRIRRSE